jgi:hypothetical protein
METDLQIANMALSRVGGKANLAGYSAGPPVAFTDNSPDAQTMTLFYVQTRDALVRRHLWKFAKTQSLLAAVAGTAGTATATGTGTTALGDTTQAWTVNAFAGWYVTITGGTGQGQQGQITSNTATVVTVSPAWNVTPDATSTYALSPSKCHTYAYALPANLLRIMEIDRHHWLLQGNMLLSSCQSITLEYIGQVTKPALFDALFVEAFVLSLALKIVMSQSQDKVLRQSIGQELVQTIRDAVLVNSIETNRESREPTWLESRRISLHG